VIAPLPPLSRAESAALRQRQRARNWLLLAALLAIVALFYAITVVRFHA